MLPGHQGAVGAPHAHVSGDLSLDVLVRSGKGHLLSKVGYHIEIKAIAMSLVVLSFYFKINYKRKTVSMNLFPTTLINLDNINILQKTVWEHWAKK